MKPIYICLVFSLHSASIFLKGAELDFVVHQQISTTQGLPYDYESVMHFEAKALSLNNFYPTITPLNVSVSPNILGSADSPTKLDYLHLNLLYCGGNEHLAN